MTKTSFKEFLKQKREEIGFPDLGKKVYIFENIEGIIIGFQGSKRWVKPKLRGMGNQLVDPKDIIYDDQKEKEEVFENWKKSKRKN